jgi:hypothetical protein
VDFLVVGMPNIVVLPDIAHVTNDQRSHACLMQRGDKARRLFVFDIPDLVFDLLELSLLRGDEALPSPRPLFHPPINTAVQYTAPEEHQRVAVEHTTFMSQLIELGRLADVDATDLIHPV